MVYAWCSKCGERTALYYGDVRGRVGISFIVLCIVGAMKEFLDCIRKQGVISVYSLFMCMENICLYFHIQHVHTSILTIIITINGVLK